MSEITRRSQVSPLPGLADLFDPFHLLWGRPADAHGIRVEARFEDGVYEVRAELPGVDPDKDVEVTVSEGTLAIHAQRAGEHEHRHRSEFSYGSFTRTVRLPEGAKTDEAAASYRGGILTVRMPVREPAKAAGRALKVARGA
jgi:HSP20 family protein